MCTKMASSGLRSRAENALYCNKHSQILSQSVSKALEDNKDERVTETAKFVSMMDKLFDCLNVHSLDAGKHHRKCF